MSLREDKTKAHLAQIKNKYCPEEKLSFQADFLQKAPVVVVVCVDKQRSYDREIENGVLATANILLEAFSRGLGTVYMSAYRSDEPRLGEEIRQPLGLPQSVDPITVIPLGYPNEIPKAKDLRPLEELIHFERF